MVLKKIIQIFLISISCIYCYYFVNEIIFKLNNINTSLIFLIVTMIIGVLICYYCLPFLVWFKFLMSVFIFCIYIFLVIKGNLEWFMYNYKLHIFLVIELIFIDALSIFRLIIINYMLIWFYSIIYFVGIFICVIS